MAKFLSNKEGRKEGFFRCCAPTVGYRVDSDTF